MANNFTVLDSTGTTRTIAATDTTGGGVYASQVQVTNSTGANFLPTGDAQARAINVIAGDGTRSTTVKAASTGAAATDTALVVRPMMGTDGTNTQPTGDAVARSIFVAVGDGARTAAVKAASTGAAATDQALVVRSLMPTDGTNTQPAGDAAARAVFVSPNDGTNKFLSGTTANMIAEVSTNAQLVTHPGQWSLFANPAVNTQASVSKAANASGRHVCTGFGASLTTDATAGTPSFVTINLRDGATGAGTVLATFNLAVATAVGSGSNFTVGGVALVGSSNTAMTIESLSTSTIGAHNQVTVWMAGYDAV